MRKIFFLLFNFMLLTGITVFSQEISGHVIDGSDGHSLPGATVYIKGTTTGTVTDIEGHFSLSSPASSGTLVISSMGYISHEQSVSANQSGDLGDIELELDAIGIDEVKVLANFAVDRKTPVAVSTIDPVQISEKLGTQEFPEILKTTPSVYATKQGGGYGDSRINLRGFDAANVGVLINGVPINDMENGWVYWSNWGGLSDVTRTMQVQRGIGASKLAISSVGGTINIITKTTDAKQGGNVMYSLGNNNYSKTSFTVSTGLLKSGWAVTISGSHTKGDGYVKGTNFEGYSYYLNVSKRLNTNNQLSFNVFGATQWHNQRSYKRRIQVYRDSPDGIRMNNNYGYLHGKVYAGGYAYNTYNKPVASLNHYWTINNKMQLKTVAYASFGRGGGRRIYGKKYLGFSYPGGEPNENTFLTPDGYLNFDTLMTINSNSLTGSESVIAMSMNSHDWYGILSTLKINLDRVIVTGGIDARFYKGYHYRVIDDLFGGKYYLDGYNKNRDATTPLHKGDYVNYHNVGKVLWTGLFGQAEYSYNQLSAFLSVSASQTQYQRIDYFQYTPEEGQESDKVKFITYSVKGGVNYNINEHFNIFANGGYFTRPPFFKYAFTGNSNTVFDAIKPEEIMTGEMGAGFKSGKVRSSIFAYYTQWKNRAITARSGDITSNITGLTAIHKGIEFVTKTNPIRKMNLGFMASVGDWRWANDATAELYDQDQNYVGKTIVYSKDVHVSDAAQITGAILWDYEILPKLKVGFDWTYFDKLFAKFEVTERGDKKDIGVDAWQMPRYCLFDFNTRYYFNIGKLEATLYGKINNLLDVEYISDANDGINHDVESSYVYYGFGRTWSMALKVRF